MPAMPSGHGVQYLHMLARGSSSDPDGPFLQVVAASALVAGLHMFGANAEVVKRWTSEISQAVQSKHAMVQYHAIALQTAVRSGDRLAISKILSALTSGAVRSPMAQCLVVRRQQTCQRIQLLEGCACRCRLVTCTQHLPLRTRHI